MTQTGSNTRRRLRWATRLAALATAILLLLPAVPLARAPMLVPAASPFAAAGAAIAARSVTTATLLAIPAFVLVLLVRRGFCRWACPVGLLTDLSGKVSPVPRSWCERLPRVGRWAAIATLAGACVGYPLLLWMDPLAILAGVFGPWRGPVTAAAAAPMLALPTVLLVSWLLPGAWCRRLCPLGATQDLVAMPGLLRRRRRVGSEAAGRAPADPQGGMPLGRRSAFALAGAAASAGLGMWLGRKVQRGAAAEGRARLRPPGAVHDPQFAGLCVRCGNCVRACPAEIIAPDLGGSGLAELLAPVVRFEGDFCRPGCVRCMLVCPSGAIRLPRGEHARQIKLAAPIGLAVVDMDLCWLADDRECSICARECPFEAITFAWSDETYTRTPVIDPARCPGCGACEVACPAGNDWERENLDPPPPPRQAIRVVQGTSPRPAPPTA